MIQARSLTAEGAEFLAEGAEKNSLRVPSRKPLRTKDPTSFFEQDSKVKTSRRGEMFIDKAVPKFEELRRSEIYLSGLHFAPPELRHPDLAIAINIRAPTEPSSGTFKDLLAAFCRTAFLCETSPSSTVKVLPYGTTSYSGFGMPLSQ